MSTDKYTHITDAELLASYREDGNAKWMGILLQRYTLLLYGVAMKYLKDEAAAQDAVQQVFLKAIIELKKYEVTYFKSWLYMVIKNHCLLLLRNKTKMIAIDEKEWGSAAEELDKDELAYNEKTMTVIETCLPKLSEEHRNCLTLFYLQQKSYQEICEITKYSMLQVKSYIQNGKRNLRILVEKELK